eukprot:Rmarinus@m.25681
MEATPDKTTTQAQDIPKSNPPTASDFLPTPGGNHFLATTPGGTRIVYDRKQMMQLRNSPFSKTPPVLPEVPGLTVPEEPIQNINERAEKVFQPTKDDKDDTMFDIEE